MTSKEEFAAKRLEAEQLIQKHAPERLQEQLIALLRPAIALTATRTEDAQIPVGASKFGGAPDVPSDFVWPMWNEKPLGFLAQINLEEVAPFDVEGLLPQSGLLSFFQLLSEEDFADYGTPQQARTWRVFHFDFKGLLRASVPDGSEGRLPIATALMNVNVKLTMPNHIYWVAGLQFHELTPEEQKQWEDWQNSGEYLRPYGKQHQMLGHPTELQDDPRYQTAHIFNSTDWQQWVLLFQMDEDEDNLDWMFGDSGAFFFIIHQNDLAVANFSNVWFVADCL